MKNNRSLHHITASMKFFLFLLPLLITWEVWPQAPHIGYVYPAGGQQGSHFTALVGGQRIKKVDTAHITGNGVSVKVLEFSEAPQKMINLIRKEMNELEGMQTNAPEDGVDQKEEMIRLKKSMKEVRKEYFGPKNQPNAQIAERVTLEIHIDSKAKPGKRELRLLGPHGVSPPLIFHVGALREVSEIKQKGKKRTVQELSDFPLLLNGQVLPGEMDRYVFFAKAKDELVFNVQARALIPYLADAVPGWFQAVLALYDEDGNEVAFTDDYKFNPDPVLFFKVTKDGKYTLEIRDSIYRGREDFVYRIAMGKLPFVTSIYPLGGSAYQTNTVKIIGKNLPSKTLKLKPQPPGTHISLPLSKRDKRYSNPIYYATSVLPEVFEKRKLIIQELDGPAIVNGHINKPGDRDTYLFTGKAGQKIVAEVHARRLHSPLDSVLRIRNQQGDVLGQNDDYKDKGAGLTTHHADSYVMCELPKDGKYTVEIEDIQKKGGFSYAYRLRISPPIPDFDLRLVPSSAYIPKGGSAVFTAYALRRDGYDGEIKLSLKNDAGNFYVDNQSIPSGEEKIRFTITAARNLAPGYYQPRLVGTGRINNNQVQRNAIPAEDMMQAFLWRHLVPTDELFIAIDEKRKLTIAADMMPGDKVKIPLGGNADVIIKNTRYKKMAKHIALVLDQPPKGVSIKKTAIDLNKNKAVLTLYADEREAQMGEKGNLIINGLVGKKKYLACTAPAIPFEIVP